MTTPKDNGPLAPRRPLGKGQQPAKDSSTPPPPAKRWFASAPTSPAEADEAAGSNGTADEAADDHSAENGKAPVTTAKSDSSDQASGTKAAAVEAPADDVDTSAPDTAADDVKTDDESDTDVPAAESTGFGAAVERLSGFGKSKAKAKATTPADEEQPAARDDFPVRDASAKDPSGSPYAPFPAPEAGPLYAPGPPRSANPAAALDVETQASLPVPPLPEPTAPATVDKKAERVAAKAQRKLEQSKPRTIRRAKLRVVRVDPWSVTKSAFLLSIAFGIMCVVAVFLVFSIMSASGLWDSVNDTIQGIVDQRPEDAFDIKDYVGMSRVMGITMLISAIDVVIITALATLGAFIYNMSASLLGGIEVTLAEDLN